MHYLNLTVLVVIIMAILSDSDALDATTQPITKPSQSTTKLSWSQWSDCEAVNGCDRPGIAIRTKGRVTVYKPCPPKDCVTTESKVPIETTAPTTAAAPGFTATSSSARVSSCFRISLTLVFLGHLFQLIFT